MSSTPIRTVPKRPVDLTPDDWAEIHHNVRRMRAESVAALLRGFITWLRAALHPQHTVRTLPR